MCSDVVISHTPKIVSSVQLYSQLDKHVSRLAASAINDDRSGREQEIEDGLAASKALNESRPCRPRHLMCLVLSLQTVEARVKFTGRHGKCIVTI